MSVILRIIIQFAPPPASIWNHYGFSLTAHKQVTMTTAQSLKYFCGASNIFSLCAVSGDVTFCHQAVVLPAYCRDVLLSLMVKYYSYAIGLEKKAAE